MSTAQKVRPPKQQQAVWTETKSLNAVKSIIRTSISQICYLRALFPENCFSVTPFAEDVSVHALTPAKEVEGSDDLVYIDDDAWALTRWLEEGVFVALEKQYLKKMAFCIYTDPGADKDKPKALVESCELHSRTNQAINQQLRALLLLSIHCALARAVRSRRLLLSWCSTTSSQTQVLLSVRPLFFLCSTPRRQLRDRVPRGGQGAVAGCLCA
jgi:hypothetical protein